MQAVKIADDSHFICWFGLMFKVLDNSYVQFTYTHFFPGHA